MNRASLKIVLVAIVCATMLAGCRTDRSESVVEKKARPVEVAVLELRQPPGAAAVSASVASWKTERIGFEVSGRVEWVVEPNVEVEAEVKDREGDTLIEGTPIARIDDEQYRLRVASAKARIAQAEQRIAAAQIEVGKTMPAQIRAAEAELKVALSRRERSTRLLNQNAISQAEFDRDEAGYETAKSTVEQVIASKNAKQADVASLQSQLLEAYQSLRDAERDLEHCTLHSSFRGQIASVAVVPGSVVTSGQEVAALQMMDPIKVEVEVSAADSLRLRNRERIPVTSTGEYGAAEQLEGFLYQIDAVADSATRTFTVTLLLMNEKELQTDIPENVATTDQTWRLDLKFLPGREDGTMFVDERAIRTDSEGPFLWRVDNAKIGEPMPKDRMLAVSKVRVRLGEGRIPFLGNWVFQQVLIDDESFDLHRDMVTSRLQVADGSPDDWNGDTVMLTSDGQWKLRPGDVVRVDLSASDVAPGYFVPMEAVVHSAGKCYLFVVDEPANSNASDANNNNNDNKTVARKMEVRLAESESNHASSTMRQVLPVETDGETLDGLRFVIRGAHYLRDSEAVNAIASAGDEQ